MVVLPDRLFFLHALVAGFVDRSAGAWYALVISYDD